MGRIGSLLDIRQVKDDLVALVRADDVRLELAPLDGHPDFDSGAFALAFSWPSATACSSGSIVIGFVPGG